MTTTSDDEVVVWWATPTMCHSRWIDELDDGERQRFAAYRRDEDRARFVTGAILVRRVLGAQLGIPPREVPLDRSCPDCARPHGKITLGAESYLAIGISVSHSGSRVGVAVSACPRIGLDVERIRAGERVHDLARFAMCRDELEQVFGADDQAAAFTAAWVRKEAILKTTGEGLRTPLTDLVISGGPSPRVLRWFGKPELVHQIQVLDLPSGTRYRAAVALLTGSKVRVAQRDATASLLS